MSLDALPVVDEVVERDAVVDRRRETVVEPAEPTWRRREELDDADEPVVAEQREGAYRAEPRTVTVGPARTEDRTVDTTTTTTETRP
jgi:hypothetical protein